MKHEWQRFCDIDPVPSDRDAVQGLASFRPRFMLTPRGEVWNLIVDHKFEDVHAEILFGLPGLISFVIGSGGIGPENAKFGDAGIRIMAKHSRMSALMICGIRGITDQSLKELRTHNKVRWLCVNCENITNAGMVHAAEMPQLLRLSVSNSKVTEASTPEIAQLTNLRNLSLFNCRFKPEAIERLQKLLPRCTVHI